MYNNSSCIHKVLLGTTIPEYKSSMKIYDLKKWCLRRTKPDFQSPNGFLLKAQLGQINYDLSGIIE